jgi:hypothetical protein
VCGAVDVPTWATPFSVTWGLRVSGGGNPGASGAPSSCSSQSLSPLKGRIERRITMSVTNAVPRITFFRSRPRGIVYFTISQEQDKDKYTPKCRCFLRRACVRIEFMDSSAFFLCILDNFPLLALRLGNISLRGFLVFGHCGGNSLCSWRRWRSFN